MSTFVAANADAAYIKLNNVKALHFFIARHLSCPTFLSGIPQMAPRSCRRWKQKGRLIVSLVLFWPGHGALFLYQTRLMSWDCSLGKLKSDIATVAYDRRSNLYQLLPYLRRLKAFRVGHIYRYGRGQTMTR